MDRLEAHRFCLDPMRLFCPRGGKRTLASGAFFVGQRSSLRLMGMRRLRGRGSRRSGGRSRLFSRWRDRRRLSRIRSRTEPARLFLFNDNGLRSPVAEVLSHMARLDRSL
jgi:hypothetical protein